VVALVAVLVAVASGCTLLTNGVRWTQGAATEPFWCAPTITGATALSNSDCLTLSAQLDEAAFFAYAHDHASDATAAGATSSTYVAGVGAAFTFTAPTATFDASHPDTLLYASTDPSAQVAGLEWNISSASAPDGFAGPNDHWTDVGGGVWQLRVWMLRPFQNEPDVFADTHPCLAAMGAIFSTTNACYTSTHPNPLQILVSNDDGYSAPGIDAAVTALNTLPNVLVTVSAPATDQSGSGGKTSTGPLTATHTRTASNFPAWAVNGFPADSVLYALNTLHVNPDLVVTGINNGQNLGPFISISGTVGAARVGGKASIPAVAMSQGLGSPADFPTGAGILVSFVNAFLLGRAGPPAQSIVTNINVPTCSPGMIRGSIQLPAATSLNGRPISPSDCQSTVPSTSFNDDVDGFLNGYVTISSIGNG
jgi:5'-nucleotidase